MYSPKSINVNIVHEIQFKETIYISMITKVESDKEDINDYIQVIQDGETNFFIFKEKLYTAFPLAHDFTVNLDIN